MDDILNSLLHLWPTFLTIAFGAAIGAYFQSRQENKQTAKERRIVTMAIAAQTTTWMIKLTGFLDLSSVGQEPKDFPRASCSVNRMLPPLPYDGSWAEICRLSPSHSAAICDLIRDIEWANMRLASLAEVVNPDELSVAVEGHAAQLLIKSREVHKKLWRDLGYTATEPLPEKAMDAISMIVSGR
jgi:hypothetical protein